MLLPQFVLLDASERKKTLKSADAGFAISDHADWNGLLQTVKSTEAEKYI